MFRFKQKAFFISDYHSDKLLLYKNVQFSGFSAKIWLIFGCFLVIFRVSLLSVDEAFSGIILGSIDTIYPGTTQKNIINFENS